MNEFANDKISELINFSMNEYNYNSKCISYSESLKSVKKDFQNQWRYTFSECITFTY